MNIATTNNNIGFSANIKFCSGEFMNALVRNKTTRVIRDKKKGITVDGMKNGLRLYTCGIKTCNAGGVTGGNTQKNLMFHIEPRMFLFRLGENIAKFDEKVKKTVSDLIKKGINPQALILGGRPVQNSSGTTSKEVFVVLNKILEKNGLKPTVFHGDPEGARSLFYDGKRNTWFVNSEGLYNGWRENPIFLTKQSAVKKYTELIKTDPNDKIIFSDTTIKGIAGKSLNQGNFEFSYEQILEKYKKFL